MQQSSAHEPARGTADSRASARRLISSSSRLPRPVPVLALALLVVTTSEFQVAAMLSSIADDLQVPVAHLGLLVTVYSLGSGLGGPVLARVLHGRSQRAALVSVLLAYGVTEAAAGLVTESSLLHVLRAVTGALSGTTFGLTLTLGMRVAPPALRTRASATILSGLMLGTLLGLPLSHALAEHAGWRASFLLLALAAGLVAAAVFALVPRVGGGGARGDGAGDVGAAEEDVDVDADAPPNSASAKPDFGPSNRPRSPLHSGTLWLRYLASFLTIGGAFAAFAFIDPILARAGITGGAATLVMLGFGAAALVVNMLGGRVEDAGRARGWLLSGLCLQGSALAALLALPATASVAVLAALALGASGMALNPLLVTRVTAVAPADVLVNTVHTSAITLGVAAATALGSLSFALVGSPSGAVAVGAALTLGALAATGLARR